MGVAVASLTGLVTSFSYLVHDSTLSTSIPGGVSGERQVPGGRRKKANLLKRRQRPHMLTDRDFIIFILLLVSVVSAKLFPVPPGAAPLSFCDHHHRPGDLCLSRAATKPALRQGSHTGGVNSVSTSPLTLVNPDMRPQK